MNFKSMSIEKLVKLKDQVESALSSKVAETKRTLQSNLSKLAGFGTASMRGLPGTARQGCSEIPQSGQSERDLGRAGIEAALACCGAQRRQEARILQHR